MARGGPEGGRGDGPGAGRGRDRRGRGRRGPDLSPSTLAPDGVPARLTRAQRFDRAAIEALDDLEQRLGDRMPAVDLAVEEVPVVPDGSGAVRRDQVPLATLVAATASARPRVLLFRRPIEHRCEASQDLPGVVMAIVVEQVADLLGVAPETIHPDYPPDED